MIQIKKETAYIDGYLTPYVESINKNTATTLIDRSLMTRFNSTYSRTVYNNGIVFKVTYANDIKNNMMQEVDQFDNSCNSYNITDLFSLIYCNSDYNETTYTNGPKRLRFKFSPNKTGILNLSMILNLSIGRNPLALNNISLLDYRSIETKQSRLYEALKHII